tara:strand:- start:452 stop:985 length:534 start_codon:yes stop_codon:yes gene_type:complete
MAYKLNGNYLQVDTPFTVGTGEDAINYPANWLRLSTADEKTAIGITEEADPTYYNKKFYQSDGTPKTLADTSETIDGIEYKYDGVKTTLKKAEKVAAATLLSKYDWYVVRKAEKSTAIPTAITTYRDAIRTACATRETEIDNCADTNALVTLYGVTTDSDGKQTPNMTQYPEDPNGL